MATEQKMQAVQTPRGVFNVVVDKNETVIGVQVTRPTTIVVATTSVDGNIGLREHFCPEKLADGTENTEFLWFGTTRGARMNMTKSGLMLTPAEDPTPAKAG